MLGLLGPSFTQDDSMVAVLVNPRRVADLNSLAP